MIDGGLGAHHRFENGVDGALGEIGVEAVAVLGVMGDDPVQEHRRRQAELLDVDLRRELSPRHRLAQEHRGERADLVAPTSEDVAQGGPDIGLGPAGRDDRAPALRLEALDEVANGGRDARAGIGDRPQMRGQLVELGLGDALAHREVQLLLAVEVPIQQSDADIGLGGDGRHRRASVSAGQHGPIRAVEDALAHLGGVGGARSWHSGGPRR